MSQTESFEQRMFPFIQDMTNTFRCRKCNGFSDKIRMLSCGHFQCLPCLTGSETECFTCHVKLAPKDILESKMISDMQNYVQELAVLYKIQQEPHVFKSPLKRTQSPMAKREAKASQESVASVPSDRLTSTDDSQATVVSKKKSKSKKTKGDTGSESDKPKKERGRMKTPSETKISESRSRSTSQPKIGLLGTALNDGEKVILKKFASKFDARIYDDFDAKVTHVIGAVTSDNPKVTVRTVKYMMGMLQNKWMLSTEWLNDCLKQKKILSEDNYELIGTKRQEAHEMGAPKKSRESGQKLFSDMSIYFDGKFKDGKNNVPSLQVLVALVEAGGARVLSSKPTNRRLTGDSGGSTLVVVDNIDKLDVTTPYQKIDVKILFDFITNFHIDSSLFK